MLQHFAHDVTIWLHQNPELGGIITFLVAFSESLAIFGIFVPALIFFTAIGALVSSGVLPVVPILVWAFAGAVLGDGISFLIGYFFREQLKVMWPFNKYQNLLEKGKKYFVQHGGKSVFISRFVGPLRAIMPIVAGIMHMKPRRFFLVNIPSAIIWSPIYMSGGFILGIAATSLSPHQGQHFVVVIGTALLIITLVFLVLRWLLSKLNYRLQSSFMRIQTLQRIFFNAIDFNHAQQTFLGLWSIVFAILFLIILILIMNQFGFTYFNVHVYDFFQMDRNPLGNKFFLLVTLFGQVQILLMWSTVIVISLFVSHHWRTAKYIIGIVMVAGATIYLLKAVTHFPRPGGELDNPNDYSFPSGHVTLGIVLYGFLSYRLAAKFPRRYHYFSLAFTAILIFFIAISRLYLGAHWFSDIIGSCLLGLIIVLLFIISYRRKPISSIDLRWFIPFLIVSFAIIYGLYAWQNFDVLLIHYQPAVSPEVPPLLPGPVLL